MFVEFNKRYEATLDPKTRAGRTTGAKVDLPFATSN